MATECAVAAGSWHAEFQFRWNNREGQSMFMLVVAAPEGQALPYAELIGKIGQDTGE